MRAIGIVRKVDTLGRIVLPVELRYTMDIAAETPLEIFVDGQSIYLKKYQPACIYCGEVVGTREFKGKLICGGCLRELKRL